MQRDCQLAQKRLYALYRMKLWNNSTESGIIWPIWPWLLLGIFLILRFDKTNGSHCQPFLLLFWSFVFFLNVACHYWSCRALLSWLSFTSALKNQYWSRHRYQGFQFHLMRDLEFHVLLILKQLVWVRCVYVFECVGMTTHSYNPCKFILETQEIIYHQTSARMGLMIVAN